MFVPPSRLACGIHRAALTLSLAGSLLVLPAAWAHAQRYDIPAGSLAEALSQFAAASGVMITFSAEDTAGLGSPGLQGDFELHQGFARLLQGSGLRLVQAGNKRYVLAKAERGAALELGATSINAAGLGATTEGTGSYTTGQSNTATKLPLTLRETPQSISVVTRQRMDDQGLNDITEVLQQTPGLSVQSLGSERFNIYSRGYSVDNYQFDGIPTTLDIATQMSAQSLADMAIYDRVEVLRGATGLMTGAGDPSATINLVRKRPTAEFKGHITAGVGSWDKYRSEVDLSGPLTPTGNVRGRMVAAYQQNNSFMDHYSQEKQIFYGVLEADLTDTTLLTVGADYQKNNPQGSSSVAFPLFHSNGEQTSFSRSTNSAARWSHNPQDALNTFASLEQKLAYDWTLKASVNQMYIKRDDYKLATASWGFPDESTGAGVRLYGGAGSTWQKQTGLDVQAQGPFQLFGRQHELIVGYNYSRYENRHTPTRGTRIEGTFVNVYDWDNYTDKPVMGGGKLYDGDTVIHQTGTYIATRLRPTDDLSVILGARVSKYDYDYDLTYPATPLSNRTTDYKENGVVTPYAGVVYDLNDIHSVYASWTSIYKPQSLRDADGSTLEPREGDNYEVGLKSEFFDGRLNTSIAAYEVKQDNLAVLDEGKTVNNDGMTAAYKAVSGATTRGFEVEANGELMPGWNVSASYNHGITKDRDGERLNTEAPANMVKLWSTYRLPGDFDRLTVGGGANWQSGTHITVTPSTALGTVKAKQSQFTVVNLMARYQLTDQLSTTLNINNLFDKKYISALDTTFYSGYYGEPRNVMLNTRYDF
ncbi:MULTISPECIES: TonB-dependent receptor [unclassified Pseudomonas]|uniref:TonB-dependent siderophore receptor n=1 Tax=unclassified Pseudomonas TaxID=196821 RepID=UPI000A0C6791|nr:MULTISPECIES: TonB-dependent receptor [unclassified Pseudomonas]SMF27427.1 outer-membrane receptor for ferric coprogen and ferric-rhodotorulic acid [Pseudomonas sp. LAIL14HWK12:I11]SMR73967.1 outer-membrane receptor for ferric coprogen and ferric-rhodotorulic acid [Pseudomonas sp. LAIL14HWK12:I10]SOD04038.1 outer-membrane receptor for ferric coprogen and ferric-rhodotorulic acid [Pseudomonas sp. LAIL14HWK12:I8]